MQNHPIDNIIKVYLTLEYLNICKRLPFISFLVSWVLLTSSVLRFCSLLLLLLRTNTSDVFGLFSASSFALFFFLKETRGKEREDNIKEIAELLNKERGNENKEKK